MISTTGCFAMVGAVIYRLAFPYSGPDARTGRRQSCDWNPAHSSGRRRMWTFDITDSFVGENEQVNDWDLLRGRH